MNPPARPRLRRACAYIAAAAVVWAYAIFLTGGFVVDLGPLRVSSRAPRNPLILAALNLLAVWWLTPAARRRGGWRTAWQTLIDAADRAVGRVSARGPHLAAYLAATLALGTTTLGLLAGAHVVGGSDSYGYVSQAELWARGSLRVEQPLLDDLPEGVPAEALVPLGYRLDPRRASLVPVYAPGLPMLMSIFQRVGGRSAVFAVTPLLAGLAVWVTFALGSRLGGPLAGVIAAALMATSPTFVLQLTHAPMSDIAAGAWWSCAVTLALRRSHRCALGAGIAAGAAILTRPNLVPLALVPGALFVLDLRGHGIPRTRAKQRVLLFAAGCVPACLVVAALNAYWYGSPIESGYGHLAGTLYRWEHWWPNVRFYARWAAVTQTPLVFLAAVSTWLLHSRVHEPARRRVLGACTALTAATYGCYAFYMPFDPWWSMRFLLPAFPAAFVLLAAALVHLCSGLPRHARWALPAVVAAIMAAHAMRFGRANGAYDSSAEWRYAAAGRYVAERMPPRAAFLTMLHSGSIRYYSGRLTVRFDYIPPERLDAVLIHLRRAGYTPFILVDPAEAPDFLARFSGRSRFGALDWPPVADVTGVKIYTVDAGAQAPAP